MLGCCACECPLHEWHQTLTLCRQPLEPGRPPTDHHNALVRAWTSRCLECDRAYARDEAILLAARGLSRSRRPRVLSFRVARLNPTAADDILFTPRLHEQLTVRAEFWCQDTMEHTLDVVAHAPNATRLQLGRFQGICRTAPGMVTMEGPLRGFDTAGWHRVHLILDDEDVGHSSAVFVLGPGTATSAYVGRDAPLPIPAEGEPRTSLHGIGVLVAGSDPESAEALGAWLVQAGARVTLAGDGADACAKATASPLPDVIVTDLVLPSMDAYELVVRVKGELGLKQAPVIAMTGDGRVGQSAHPFEAVLMKPITPRDVGDAILEVLRRRRRPA